ncbi:MAG: amidase family protein [Acidimicrobiia bacterium]|nr:amidase family protein [Acidimicrobiia bacterium]
MTDELATLDATAQADLVRSGAVSRRELVDAAIARIEKTNPEINAVISTRFERAVTDIDAVDAVDAIDDSPPSDAPFPGVPFLLKDLACPMAGEPSHEGMRALREAEHTATHDGHLTRRYRRAGLVVLGRTNTPELGLLPTTEPDSYGPTRNPWDPQRTPGGSSGGSAAAVAAGLVPFAHGSDGGGSIRIPAAACGLVGLKTSRGRVSIGPHAGELNRFLSVQFALTRSVRDAAALLDVAAGEETGDPIVAPPARRPYLDEVGVDPGRLRVGLMTSIPGTADPVHPECVAAAQDAAGLLESLGHHVEVSHPAAFDDPSRVGPFLTVWSANAAYALDSWGRALGRDLGEGDVEPLTWALASHGRSTSATQFLTAVGEMQSWCRSFLDWWDEFDVLLTPTLGEPTPALGSFAATSESPMAGFMRSASFTPYTPVCNQTGQPAISLPLGHDSDGMPLGTHLVAAPFREDLLIRVAAQLEDARPWSGRRPTIHA